MEFFEDIKDTEKLENSIIGSFIAYGSDPLDAVYTETLIDALAKIKDTDFIGAFNRRTFQIISQHHRKHHFFPGPDLIAQTERKDAELLGYDVEAEIGQRMMMLNPTFISLSHDVKRLKGKSKKRTVLREEDRYRRELIESNDEEDQINRITSEHLARVDRINDDYGDSSLISCASHIWLDFLTEIETKKHAAVYPTGFSQLDAELSGGFKAGTMNIIGARPGVGKTALATQAAYNIAAAGHSVLFYSLEMSKKEIIIRTYQQQTGNTIDPAFPVISKKEAGDFNQCLNDIHFYLFDGVANITDIEYLTSYYKRKFRTNVVVIDYVGRIGARKELEGQTEYTILTDISKKLAELAKRQNIALIVLAQINREGTKNAKQNKPNMGNLKGTGGLEQDAHTVLLLNKPENTLNRREVIVDKNRNGHAGAVIEYEFDGTHTRFNEVRKLGDAISKNTSGFGFFNTGVF